MTAELPFHPEPSSWPLAVIYTGPLSPDAFTTLNDAKVIAGDDSDDIASALAALAENLSPDTLKQFSDRFAYRQYKHFPLADSAVSQAEGECFASQSDASADPPIVRRLYEHPSLKEPAFDIAVEMTDRGMIKTHSLLTVDVALLFSGDAGFAPTLYTLHFDSSARTFQGSVYGAREKIAEPSFVSLRHAEHFFSWQRALAAKQAFDYAPEDLGQPKPYLLLQYITRRTERFIQYYDKRNTYKFGDYVFHPERFGDETPEQIAEQFGYTRLYACDVTVPPGHKVTAWSPGFLRQTGFLTLEDGSADGTNESPDPIIYTNERRLHPAPPSPMTDEQRERYDKANAIFRSGHYSYQGILDLYNEQLDCDSVPWIVILSLAYSNPRDSFYDENKANDLIAKAIALGSPTSAYNHAIHWRDGAFGRVDLEQAKFWFRRAFEEDESDAGISLFELLRKEPQYGDEKHPEFTNAADQVFYRTQKLGGQWVRLRQSQYEAVGLWHKRNPEVALRRLKALAVGPTTTRPEVIALLRLALRYFLGMDVPRDPRQALRYLEQIPLDKGDNVVPPGIRQTTAKLRKMIFDEIGSPQEEVPASSLPKPVLAQPPPEPPAQARLSIPAPSEQSRRWRIPVGVGLALVAGGIFWAQLTPRSEKPPSPVEMALVPKQTASPIPSAQEEEEAKAKAKAAQEEDRARKRAEEAQHEREREAARIADEAAHAERMTRWNAVTTQFFGVPLKPGEAPCDAPVLRGSRCFAVNINAPDRLSFRVGDAPRDALDNKTSLEVTLSAEEWTLRIHQQRWFYPSQGWQRVPGRIAGLDTGTQGAASKVLSLFGFTDAMVASCEEIIEQRRELNIGAGSTGSDRPTFSCVNRPAWRGDPAQFEFTVRSPLTRTASEPQPPGSVSRNIPRALSSPNGREAYVVARGLNVRATPRRGAVVGTLVCGTKITRVDDSHDDWVSVSTADGVSGYVASRYLSGRPPTLQQCQP